MKLSNAEIELVYHALHAKKYFHQEQINRLEKAKLHEQTTEEAWNIRKSLAHHTSNLKKTKELLKRIQDGA